MSERQPAALDRSIWPLDRLGDALTTLAAQSGLTTTGRVAENPRYLSALEDPHTLELWMESAGLTLDVDVDAVDAAYRDADALLRAAHPMVLRYRSGVITVLRARRGRLTLIGPDGSTSRVPLDEVRQALLHDQEAGARELCDTLLEQADIPRRRRARASRALLADMMAGRRDLVGWLLRLPARAPFGKQLWRAGAMRPLTLLLCAHLAQYLCFLFAWWTIGVGVLSGHMSAGWLLSWALLLATLVPLRMATTWYQGRSSVLVGMLLQKRLLGGAMRLTADSVRHQGVGALLGRALEAQAVERLALGGGIASALALVEFVLAAVILASGAGGLVHLAVLLAWLGLAGWLGARLARSQGAWTDRRLHLTDVTVERMVGHRTRLAQELPERWHDGEDQALWPYSGQSMVMDQRDATLLVLIPRGWLIVGMATLSGAFIGGAETGALAVAVGGVLLAWRSFARLTEGIEQLVGASIAWQRVGPLFHAAAHPVQTGAPDHVIIPRAPGPQPVLEAHDLGFRYPGSESPVLRECDLTIHAGDRILLEGPSGGGKSTLASVLLGTRVPTTGLVLASGLDRPTLGASGWRRRVSAAPQFHENHVLTETIAFNLLMGRQWPPAPGDLREAEAICRQLGLGPLLERMPSGMFQMVGETGWQLSHGERSRLFIARALLQDSDVVILDESFAALDPENLERALDCARARARSLVVIAHP